MRGAVSITTARAPARKRKPRRRRHYRKFHVSRWATFGAGFALPCWGWAYLGEPWHWAGLAVMVADGEVLVPAGVLFVLFASPALVMGGPFRQVRIGHRKRHGRERCKSAYITKSLERVVYAMDRDRCLYCGITAAQLAALPPRIGKDGREYRRCLHVDHGKPWIAGFPTTLLNLGLLCDEHNEIKSCYYRERNGYVWYHRESRSPERLLEAALITRKVLLARWELSRLLRACWALG